MSSPVMSPFFKPEPRRGACYECYKNTLYSIVGSLALAAIISLPWLIELTRDILTEQNTGQRQKSPPSDAWIYCTVAAVMVIYAIVLAIAGFVIYSER